MCCINWTFLNKMTSILLTCVIGGSLIFGVVVLLLVSLQSKKQAKYFRDRNVPYQGSGFSIFMQLLLGKVTVLETEVTSYKKAVDTGAPMVGYLDFFTSPAYYVTDLDLMRNIYTKDFDHFVNRRKIVTPKENVFTKMLLNLSSEEWKGLRAKLSPTFTTGKIRRMFSIFEKSSERMCQYLENIVGSSGKDYDLTEVYSKYAMDVIANCAFGVDSKSFEHSPGIPSEFEHFGKEFQFKFKTLLFLKFVLTQIAPKITKALGITPFDVNPQNYFQRVIKEVMTHRREKGERQDDFLQLMMDAQAGLLKSEENLKETLEVMNGSAEENLKTRFIEEGTVAKLKFDDDMIVANCMLFLLAGYDTLQSLLIFAAYELAVEQEVQEKLHRYLKKAVEKNGGKLSYDLVHESNYLDLVINETLRLLPPTSRSERVCTRDYKVPGTDVVIEKGQIVALPVYAVHHDLRYYEDPEKFIPERFLPENKSKRHPYSFAAFGHGPRNCIGMRFALTEAKAVIASLVLNFKLEPCTKTDIPPKFSTNSSLKPANGMWLNIHPRRYSQ